MSDPTPPHDERQPPENRFDEREVKATPTVRPAGDAPTAEKHPLRNDAIQEISDSPTSFQPIERSRLIPKISFRFAFLVTTGIAILFAIARAADRGIALAIAAIVSVGFVLSVMAALVILFFLAWSFAALFGKKDPDLKTGSPFAKDQLPPQWLPPREQESR